MKVVILENIRSTQNVGSIIRSADGFGIDAVVCVGITPYPAVANDTRLPHIVRSLTTKIAKTSLGAEQHMDIKYFPNMTQALKNYDLPIYVLEQHTNSTNIRDIQPHDDWILIVGNEVEGVSSSAVQCAQKIIEIPMSGQKESFNVAVSTAIALYQLTD